MDIVDHFEARPGGAVRRLVVILHGFWTADAKRPSMMRAVRELFPDADLYAPELPYRRPLCDEPLTDIVAHLAGEVSRRFAATSYDEIIVLGHSTGALVARKLVLAAWGVAEDVPLAMPNGSDRLPWAEKVVRLVFLAAINRGWTFNSAIGFIEGLSWRAGIRFLQLRGWTKGLFGKERQATILQSRRGSPFLATTRLQWLGLMADPTRRPPQDMLIIQTIGTIDDLVSPEDAVDHVLDAVTVMDQSKEGPSRKRQPNWARFFMLELEQTNHMEAASFHAASGDDQPHAERRRVLKIALTADDRALIVDPRFIRRRHVEDDLPPRPDSRIEDVVFVIHGIRDKGFWTSKIARKVKERAGKQVWPAEPVRRDRFVRSVTASYGYFPMAPFVLRWVRQEKVEWLIDLYVEVRARYPKARLHYVGHSNGTYLLAGALACCPRLRFENVVFAGSVVRRDYDWARLLDPDQSGESRVARLLNYVATADWVVAIFPNALQRFRAIDLGSAGHDGFDMEPQQARMLDVRYVEGSHGAGIRESQWDEIAAFVLDGTLPFDKGKPVPPGKENPDFRSAQDERTLWLARNSFGILCVGIAVALALVLLPLGIALWCQSGPLASALLGAASILVALAFKAILTRF